MSPYRIPLFRELGTRFDFELWILGDINELREWKGEAPDETFQWKKLPHWGFGVGSRYARFVVNPGLLGELEKGSWDAVIVCGWDTVSAWLATFWARRRGVPCVLWSGSTDREVTLLRTLTKPCVRRLVRKPNAWLAYGSRAATYLASLGAAPSRIFKAFNTIDVDYVATTAQLTESGRKCLRDSLRLETPHVVLYCGNMIPLKGLDYLLPAFAALRAYRNDVTLLMVGSGSHEAHYKSLADTLGVGNYVRWTGYVSPEIVPQYFGLASIAVLPSWLEVWGLVVNEALACGVPVIVSDAAGASEDLITHGVNGYVVPPRDTNGIEKAMGDFFASDDNPRRMSQAARDSIQPYNVSAMADAFAAAVECAIADNR